MKQASFRQYAGAKTVALRFYLRQNIRQTMIIAWVAAISAATSLVGFVNTYPDEASRQAFTTSFTNNTGLKLLLGTPHDIASVGGFVAWRALGILVLIGSIWGLMLATRLFRGEEQAGRTELLLSGQTTLRRITAQQTMVSILLSTIIFALIFVGTYGAAIYKNTQFSVTSITFFALSVTLAVTVFMAIGALLGQLFATRTQALRVGAIIYGVFFIARGMGASVSSVHILEDISPIGWIQNLQAFTGSYWQWLIPLFITIGGCFGFAIWLAGRRDLDSSIIADKDTARPKLWSVSSPLRLWVRLSRLTVIGWAMGIAIMGYMFGTIAKSAGDSFSSSAAARNIIDRLTQSSDVIGEKQFYGMVFLIIMLLVLVLIAGMIAAIRNEEADGYLDNMLVRKVARLQVIKSRLLIVFCTVLIIALLATFTAWLGGRTQGVSVTLIDLLPATASIAAIGMFVIGIGVFTYGFYPRLTSLIMYGLIGWAFLVEMLGSALNLNHWILDTSILHHMPLVPAVDANWRIISTYLGVGVVLVLIGTLRFTRRDIEIS